MVENKPTDPSEKPESKKAAKKEAKKAEKAIKKAEHKSGTEQSQSAVEESTFIPPFSCSRFIMSYF